MSLLASREVKEGDPVTGLAGAPISIGSASSVVGWRSVYYQ